MAMFTVHGDELILELTGAEKIEAIHEDIRVPLSSVREVEILEDALDAFHGIRTGTGIPGVLVVGTIRWKSARAFVVVHHGHPRGVRVRLEKSDYDQLIVGCDDPEGVAATIPVTP
ncbi:hypothetical protein ACVXZ4_10330 [Lacisediminihabitans sp. FW035]